MKSFERSTFSAAFTRLAGLVIIASLSHAEEGEFELLPRGFVGSEPIEEVTYNIDLGSFDHITPTQKIEGSYPYLHVRRGIPLALESYAPPLGVNFDLGHLTGFPREARAFFWTAENHNHPYGRLRAFQAGELEGNRALYTWGRPDPLDVQLYRRLKFQGSNFQNFFHPELTPSGSPLRLFDPFTTSTPSEGPFDLASAPFVPTSGIEGLNQCDNLIVLIHGWNRVSHANPFHSTEEWNNFSQLYAALRDSIVLQNSLSKSSTWGLIEYNWGADSDTGPRILTGPSEANRPLQGSSDALLIGALSHPTRAAEIGVLHGKYLAMSLKLHGGSRIRKVHFIAHSAGSWVARSACRFLLEPEGEQGFESLILDTKIQLTLLDGFMPGNVNSVESALDSTCMSNLKVATINGQVVSFFGDNYFADNPVVWATQERLIRWDIPGQRTDSGLFSGDPDGHAGPIWWYAQTARPGYWDVDPVSGKPWSDGQGGRGFGESLLYKELSGFNPSPLVYRGGKKFWLEQNTFTGQETLLVEFDHPSLYSSESTYGNLEISNLNTYGLRFGGIRSVRTKSGRTRSFLEFKSYGPYLHFEPDLFFIVNMADEAFPVHIRGFETFRLRNPRSFADVANDDWFRPYLLRGLDQHVLRFDTEGSSLGKSKSCMRWEVAEMIDLCRRELGLDRSFPSDIDRFTDVPEDAHYFNFVYSLKSRGVVSGELGQGKLFSPERFVTRAELCKLLCLGVLGANPPELSQNAYSGLAPDLLEAPQPLWKYMAYLLTTEVERNATTGGAPRSRIISGDHGTGRVRPNEAVNRAELCKFIVQAFEHAANR